jgi:hypothetical protein
MKERINELRQQGLSATKIANQLNAEGSLTPSGLEWTAKHVYNHENSGEKTLRTPQELLKKDPANKLALTDLDDRRKYFASGNLDIWAMKHINEEYGK